MRDLAREFPERQVLAVDTLAASGGQGLLVWHAVQRARAGASIVEVRDWLEENKLHLAHWFTVDDLMFLFRGGQRVGGDGRLGGQRCSTSSPCMHVDDEGHLIPPGEGARPQEVASTRWWTTWRRRAIEPVDQQMVFITHGDCLEEAEYVADQVKQRFGVPEIVINYVDPVIGAHSGPGTMALFFLADKR